MMRWWLAVLVVAGAMAGCAKPQSEPAMAPVLESAAKPEDHAGPMLEPTIIGGLAEPAPAPKARPHKRPHCLPGDDGIGGTGCPVD